MENLKQNEWFEQNDYHYRLFVDSEGEFLREAIKLLTLLSSGSIALMLTLVQIISPTFEAEPLLYVAGGSFVLSLIASLLYNFSGKANCVDQQEILRHTREAEVFRLEKDYDAFNSSLASVRTAEKEARKSKSHLVLTGGVALSTCILGILLFTIFGGINLHAKAEMARRAALSARNRRLPVQRQVSKPEPAAKQTNTQ